MLRLGEKYGHLARRAGCGCCNPDLHKASRRLAAFSRRGLLGGAAAATVAGLLPRSAGAQTSAPPSRILFREARLFDSVSGQVKERAQLLVENNRIASVDFSNAPPPATPPSSPAATGFSFPASSTHTGMRSSPPCR